MDLIFSAFQQAIGLLKRADPELLRISWLSLRVSLTATFISLLIGFPLGTWLALNRFRGRQLCISLINTGMGTPPVIAGLIVTLLICRSGPFGLFGILYSPTAIIVAQVVLAIPLITGLTIAAIQHLPPLLRLQILSLGATRWQCLWLLWREARLPLLAAIMAGFGGVISEVGAAMMVGGNIIGETRVLTTAIVLENSKGNFDLALALGIILMTLIYLVNFFLTWVQQQGRPQ